MKSNLIQAELIAARGLPRDHQHLNFSQLYGMSDHITFNLAAAGFNVAKYLPYGPVKEVLPYLIRRARENSAVTGEMSRELGLIVAEMKRRGLK
jgi:proline dehydrogenase